MSRQIYGPWDLGFPPVVGPSGNAPPGAKPTMESFASDYQNAVAASRSTHTDVSRVMETGTYADTWPFGLLAHAYAVSDAWYGATPTQTNPNRAFMACGTSQGWTDNGSKGFNSFTAPTIWNRLHHAGKTWKIYWENTFLPQVGKKPWTRECFTQLSSFGDEYFPHIGAFHRDAKLGRLPFFSFIEPSWTLEDYFDGDLEGFQGNDVHPPGDVRPGLQFLAAIFSSLVSNQEAWAKTLLLVTFDEHGGTFDHVAPPDNVTSDTNHPPDKFQFNRVGPRVPTLLISPMVEAGTVFRSTQPSSGGRSFPYDHTSIPATVLKLAGLSPDEYGLFDRTKVAPTFEGVLTRASDPRTDTSHGTPGGDECEETQAAASDLVNYGDAFRLRYASPGPLRGRFVSGNSYDDGSYLWLSSSPQSAFAFRFTVGYSGKSHVPKTFVRTTGLVYLQIYDSSPSDSRNSGYIRVPDSVFDDYCELGKDDAWWYSQWYISLADRERLGWGLTWGAEVTLEYHALNSKKHWLPRKMITRESGSTYYVGVGADADFANASAGRWTIERV